MNEIGGDRVLGKKLQTRIGSRTVVMALALVLATAGCNSRAGSSTGSAGGPISCPTEDASGKVVLTTSAKIEAFAPVLLAISTGAFADAGLDVSLKMLSSSEQLAPVAQGRIDGQLTSLSAGVFNAVNAGVNVKWVMPFYELPPADPGVALPGYWARTEYVGTGEDPDVTGLKGSQVGSPSRGDGIGGLIMENVLRTDGLSLDDVTFTELAGPDALIAVENDSVAATWLSQPLEVEADKNPGLRLIGTYEPGINGSGLVVGRGLLDRPQVLVKLLEVVRATSQKYLQGDYRREPQTRELLAEVLESDPATLKEGSSLVFDPTLSMADAPEFTDRVQKYLIRQGALEYEEPLDPNNIVDARFSETLATCQ